jgi:hypothetical protein
VTLSGAPYSELAVQVGTGLLQPVLAIIDSGGVYGTMPSSVIGNSQTSGNLPVGTRISVYTADGRTLLYTYTTNGWGPTVFTGTGAMNTGYTPFAQNAVYVGLYGENDMGTTIFDWV